MTGDMCRQPFGYTAQISNFFQIGVHALVTYSRQKYTFLYTLYIIFVLSKYSLRNRQYRYIAHLISFLSCLAYPQCTVIVSYQVLAAQLLNICESERGKTAENKSISYLFQSFDRKLFIQQNIQFLTG